MTPYDVLRRHLYNLGETTVDIPQNSWLTDCLKLSDIFFVIIYFLLY